jgi:hypothetical protein
MKIKIQLEIEVDVDGTYHPSDPGKWTLSNGDPGYPPEPAEYEINKVMWGDLDITKMLSGDDFNEIEYTILNNLEE